MAQASIADHWYITAPKIKRGEVDFEARRLIVQLLRPHLEVDKTFSLKNEASETDTTEALHQLVSLEFKPAANHPRSDEILAAWPQIEAHEIALFRALDRALLDALEETEDAGLLEGSDRTSWDVPSVARHPQNEHHSGFYPITRLLADLWQRIALRDAARARSLALIWSESRFLLVQRLFLFAMEHAVLSAQEADTAVQKLDDATFWASDAQVEIMRILAGRWKEFDTADRQAIEGRLRQGTPRTLYREGAFEDEDEWVTVRDASIYRRLKRIETADGELAEDSKKLLTEIAERHPKWQPSIGDRDDFRSWHETRWGFDGHPDLLAGIADDRLVDEAMRLQRERHFEEGDIWRVFCSADPERALRGLKVAASSGRWVPDAWQYLLWSANEKGDVDFQFVLADSLLQMPEIALRELLPAATSWLQRRRTVVSAADRVGGPRFLPLWDRFADLTYIAAEDAEDRLESKDLLTESLNAPGGILAWALLDALGAPTPTADSGLGAELKPRFDRVAGAIGRPGLLARVYLIWALAYLDAIDRNGPQQILQTGFRGSIPRRWLCGALLLTATSVRLASLTRSSRRSYWHLNSTNFPKTNLKVWCQNCSVFACGTAREMPLNINSRPQR